MMTNDKRDLRTRQDASAEFEMRLIKALVDDPACRQLKVGEVLGIAHYARLIAFDVFSAAAPEGH